MARDCNNGRAGMIYDSLRAGRGNGCHLNWYVSDPAANFKVAVVTESFCRIDNQRSRNGCNSRVTQSPPFTEANLN